MLTGLQGGVLRRNGDKIQLVHNSQHLATINRTEILYTPYYGALGRCDYIMNIGGIKFGSVEIKRV